MRCDAMRCDASCRCRRRCNYIRKRLLDIADGKPPPRANYLDSTGKEQQWSARELAGGETYYIVDWVNPVSWYRWSTAPPLAAGGPDQSTLPDRASAQL